MDWQKAEREYTDEVIGENTVPQLFEERAERSSERTSQMYKGGVYDRSLTDSVVPQAPDGEFTSLTYDKTRDIVAKLTTGLRELGLEKGDRVGIFANTRMEWAQSDFAILAAGGVVTTVYTSSSPNQVEYLLDNPGASGVVVENEELLERVLEVEDNLDLHFIVSMDELDGYGDREDVYTLGEVHEIGDDVFVEDDYTDWVESGEPDDLASIIYTSGTTGRPKGVQLTQRNFRSNLNQVRKRFGPRPDKPDDVPVVDEKVTGVSFLPLAHVFERLAGHFFMFASGATVAYAESPDTVREDFGKVKPDGGTSVPRVYEKVYEAITEEAEGSAVRERIFEWSTDVARDYFEAESPGPVLRAKHALADRLVYSQVREALGGNVKYLISGGGSLSADLGKLFHGMGLPILEGYGLTETSPVVSANPAEDPKVGTIGPPVDGVEIKIDTTVATESNLEEAEGDVGELLVKGPNVFDGYWKKPQATERAFTEDGWFRTGDIIEELPNGYLKFHDRAKQLIVLSTGKNVAPQPIEDRFATKPLVEQIMVLGNERKFISAVVVPNFEDVRRRAEREGVELPATEGEICDDKRVNDWVGEVIDDVNEHFESYETIKKFRLVPFEFTEDNDLLTPTMKKKRRNILDRFEEQVESMYADEE